jgi:hypothetical protein
MSYPTLRYIQSQRHWVFTPYKSFLLYPASVRCSVLEVIAKVEYFENNNILPFGGVAKFLSTIVVSCPSLIHAPTSGIYYKDPPRCTQRNEVISHQQHVVYIEIQNYEPKESDHRSRTGNTSA